MESMYITLNRLNLIDKDDIILYLSSQDDIIDKIAEKRILLRKNYRIFKKNSDIVKRFFKFVCFRNNLKDLIYTKRNIDRNYINEETLLGEPIDYIPDEYFYSYKENGYYYAFDFARIPTNFKKYSKKSALQIVKYLEKLYFI